VKGLGLIGIFQLLDCYTNSLPTPPSTTGISQLNLLIDLSANPAILPRHTVYIVCHLRNHPAQFQAH
jgi:hypothetical protein